MTREAIFRFIDDIQYYFSSHKATKEEHDDFFWNLFNSSFGSDKADELMDVVNNKSRSCGTCKYWRLWKKETNLHKCAGQNGCEIVGKDFYCSNWEG